ncbi:MAG: MFS transporter [Gaiellaceae bacterium]|jgi:EmrB/QacA subfamily drug resistance transporter
MRARLFAPELRKWWTLFAVAFGLFMIMLDNTVVNVALPSIREDLGISISELEWVVNGYALTFGVLLLSGGKLADMLGRRRIFIIGLVIFTASSFFCGFASSASVLIGARVVQGVGAALMNPATLSIITATFPPRQRGTAIGIWAGVSAMALAFGPLVGGAITEHINWSWVFYINVPIGIVAIVAARLLIDETRDTTEQKLDPLGLVTSAAALFALTFALIESNRRGWGDPLVLGLFAASALCFVAFFLVERHQRLPMLDLNLFRNRSFASANVVMLLIGLAMFGTFFFVSLYVQNVLRYSPIQAGATFLPMTMFIIFVAPVAGKLADKIGPRALMVPGLALVTASLVLFSIQDETSTFWTLLPALLVGGLGMAMAMAPTTTAAMHAVPVDKAGVGSAVINSMRQVGGSVGIALMGAIVATQFNAARPNPHDFVNGFQLGLRVAAGIAFAGVFVAAFGIKPEQLRHDVPKPTAAAEAA